MTNFASKLFDETKFYGVDPSPKSIEIAQEKFPHINFSANSEETAQ